MFSSEYRDILINRRNKYNGVNTQKQVLSEKNRATISTGLLHENRVGVGYNTLRVGKPGAEHSGEDKH